MCLRVLSFVGKLFQAVQLEQELLRARQELLKYQIQVDNLTQTGRVSH